MNKEQLKQIINKKNFYINSLALEITRKCTLKCAHCFKGEAENVNMSTDVLSETFDFFKNVKDLYLMGGEPQLNLCGIDEIRNQLEKNKTRISSLRFVTNGTIFDKEYFDILTNIQKNSKAKIFVRTSNTYWHKKAYKTAGYDLSEIRQNVKIFQKKYPNINLEYSSLDFKYQSIVESGRAVELAERPDINTESVLEYFLRNENNFDLLLALPLHFTKLKNEDDYLLSYFEISAKGDIAMPLFSYKDVENDNFGNILKDPISDILTSQGNFVANNSKSLSALRRHYENIYEKLYGEQPYNRKEIVLEK